MKYAVLAFALLAACKHVPNRPDGQLQAAGLEGLYCVQHVGAACTIYRSSQPTADQFKVLVSQYGIKSVLKLNTAIEGRDHVPASVDLFEDPMLGFGPIDHDEIARALDYVEYAAKPLLIHCESGVDRTGLVIALYRVKHGSWVQAAWNEWLAYGSHRFRLIEDAFFRETGWRP